MLIHCSICKEELNYGDFVFLDQMNSLSHLNCYSLEDNFPIKDLGTYEQLIKLYSFIE